jgi:hypothetical protein
MTENSYSTRFHVRATPEAVYAAINDPRAWWDGEFDGSSDSVGDEFTYRYDDLHTSRQRVTGLTPNKRVSWLVVEGGPTFVETSDEWAGTTIVFDISPAGDETEVRFTHVGLVPRFECYDACSAAWTHYVGDSLRRFGGAARGGRARCRRSGGGRSPAMASTKASAAARPAMIRSWPGWPSTTPVIVVGFPSILRMARKAKQPPAASSEPVLTPTNPSCPSNVSVLCTMPATGSAALGVATMLANTGTRIARSTMRTWSAAVDTVASS